MQTMYNSLKVAVPKDLVKPTYWFQLLLLKIRWQDVGRISLQPERQELVITCQSSWSRWTQWSDWSRDWRLPIFWFWRNFWYWLEGKNLSPIILAWPIVSPIFPSNTIILTATMFSNHCLLFCRKQFVLLGFLVGSRSSGLPVYSLSYEIAQP